MRTAIFDRMLVLRALSIAVVMLDFAHPASAQDEMLVNKVGTKLGTKSRFIRNCKAQCAKEADLRIFPSDRFCECMIPIALAAPAIALSKNPDLLDGLSIGALWNNSSTSFEEMVTCTGMDMTSMHLSAMGPDGVRRFRSGCAEQLAKDPNITATGAQAEMLCDCMVDAVLQRDLTIGDLQAAMNPNSPLFNEVFVPCVTNAIPASSAYASAPEDITGPQGSATVPVISLGKVHKVKVHVGGTDQYFIIDSGAEDCIISEAFLKELQAAGAVDTTEHLTPREYLMADGSRATYQRHVLNGVEVGPFKADRVVAASIDQNIQYLLGKSFLNKFKEWRIDEEGKTITLRR